eukprot:2018156-Amphidinium_carterae.1
MTTTRTTMTTTYLVPLPGGYHYKQWSTIGDSGFFTETLVATSCLPLASSRAAFADDKSSCKLCRSSLYCSIKTSASRSCTSS